jgi:hypothetical protein
MGDHGGSGLLGCGSLGALSHRIRVALQHDQPGRSTMDTLLRFVRDRQMLVVAGTHLTNTPKRWPDLPRCTETNHPVRLTGHRVIGTRRAAQIGVSWRHRRPASAVTTTAG